MALRHITVRLLPRSLPSSPATLSALSRPPALLFPPTLPRAVPLAGSLPGALLRSLASAAESRSLPPPQQPLAPTPTGIAAPVPLAPSSPLGSSSTLGASSPLGPSGPHGSLSDVPASPSPLGPRFASPGSPFGRGFFTAATQGPSESRGRWWRPGWVGAGAAVTAALAGLVQVALSDAGEDAGNEGGAEKKDGVFTAEEVAKHRTKETGIWVTYKDGVYDITDFVDVHPGGPARIMLAAGSAIDPFWAMYQQHNTEQVRDILEEHRIGRLLGAPRAVQVADPYANEPPRHPALIPRSQKPCNAETPAQVLADQLVTPTDLHYVRNHMPVPAVDAATYKLVIEGEGLRRVELSLSDLRTLFKKRSVPATLQCSGNRRHEMSAVKKVKGLDWDVGAISTAVWGGVLLRDILLYAGFDPGSNPQVAHVHFYGLDTAGDDAAYGASIPIDKAFGAAGDVLLAYEMNGSDLPRDKGFPIRALVPGVTAARSVKWLGRIVVSEAESDSHWQQFDYKSFCPSVDWDSVDWASAPSIQDTPVTSAICDPPAGSTVDGDEVTVQGYAFSGGGRGIIRVDVSTDNGTTWQVAKLKQLPQKPNRAWAWTLWEATLPVPKGHQGHLQLVCKAVDASYNSQPDTVAPIWNIRGVLNNSWHRVKVNVGR